MKNLDLDLLERKYDQEHFLEEGYDSGSIELNTKFSDDIGGVKGINTESDEPINGIIVRVYKTNMHTLKWIKDN